MELMQFISAFDTEEKCAQHLAAIRWPNGPVCDKCGSVGNAGKSQRPRYWHCHNCRQMFSVTAGTPMEETRLPLSKWFAAIFLIVTSSCPKGTPQGVKGISSMAISRQIGVSYKTAWFLTHRIRAMLDTDDALLRGVVEVDETVRRVGAHRKHMEETTCSDSQDQSDVHPTNPGEQWLQPRKRTGDKSMSGARPKGKEPRRNGGVRTRCIRRMLNCVNPRSGV